MERLEVVDEYNELSRKTARLFSQMSDTVVADFYFKIDDDVGAWRDASASPWRPRHPVCPCPRHCPPPANNLPWHGLCTHALLHRVALPAATCNAPSQLSLSAFFFYTVEHKRGMLALAVSLSSATSMARIFQRSTHQPIAATPPLLYAAAVNIAALAEYLSERRGQGNLYLGCMKSGEVLTDKRWKW